MGIRTALGFAFLLLTGVPGCYTFTCNDFCEIRIECLEEAIEARACAQECVRQIDVETQAQRDARMACWSCADLAACDDLKSGSCREKCGQ